MAQAVSLARSRACIERLANKSSAASPQKRSRTSGVFSTYGRVVGLTFGARHQAMSRHVIPGSQLGATGPLASGSLDVGSCMISPILEFLKRYEPQLS